MGIGVSVFLIAVGAILAFAVNVTTSGVDLSTIGYILMVVGAIGLLVALAVMNGWGWGGPRGGAVVEDEYGEPVGRRVVRRRSYVD
jgi:uncharacterized membrane protein